MSDDKLNWAGASIGFSEANLCGGDESADAVAAELATLLPRLPRVKITPQTISQTIIDRWYGHETEYRQTIAELRAELAAAREYAQTAHNQTAELGAEVVRLRAVIADEHSQLSHLLDNAEVVARLSGELVDARDANVLLRKGITKVRAELDKCAVLNRNLVNESAELVVERDRARTELAELRDDYANLQTEASQIADRAGRYRQELAELRERIGETPGLGGYTIGCDGDDATQWPYVECNRCRHDVWTGRYTGSALNLADAVDQVAAHNCDKAAKLRNIITEGG